MTCKDCPHFDVCKMYGALPTKRRINSKWKNCPFRNDKSKYIELPNIEIGQELFYIDKFEKRVKSDTVSKLTFEKNELGIDTGVWSDNYGFSMFFSDVGKTLFLTKEEAETKLKELNGNEKA